MTVLSVNLNKIALLRNSRGADLPGVEQAAKTCIAAGCGGITVHPRPDQRHIRPDDVRALKSWLPVELNIEGNPYAGSNASGFPGFLELVEEVRPAQCTLVPDGDAQLTSDHGFEFPADAEGLAPLVGRLKALGIRISVFVDPDCADLAAAARIGIDRVELYTGPYASAFAAGRPEEALAACARTAAQARSVGMGVNAGHDLDLRNLGSLLRAVPEILEVSIGHALIAEALYEGMVATVRNYCAVIASAR